ncbi:MAG TPA: hypothetical protein VFZ09_15180 [Archangium sp.]|uniref:hypothetical protein n=1 Tax=Archangium sp. TaxID=1872627 RepID=UPI002E376038|nr:hypothetical protein [Archangium sp.]HEX5747588.1 hypothetical protein [Archangium sp.]
MSKTVQGLLTFLISLVVPTVVLLILSVLPVWQGILSPQTVSALPKVALIVGGSFGLLHGLEAGILCIYDLETAVGWIELFIDLTWSLPNTMAGFVLGNIIYIFFGNPSRTDSEGQAWISFQPRNSGGFGHSVLQTIGTVNLGGAGQHERMHLLQARVLGPGYIPLVIASYSVTFTLQVVWTLTLGGLLALTGVRNKAYFEPPSHSAVGGFFGWIYYATPIELFAYATGNP